MTTNKSLKISYQKLYKWNVAMAGLHFVQALVVLLLSKASTLPVVTNYLSLDAIASEVAGRPVLVQAQRTLFEINLAYLIVLFFMLSAVAHAVIATVYRKRYEADLKQGINRVRWIEYSLSASVMMLAIALLSGVYELSLLIAIFALDAIMNLMGLVMETYHKPGKNVNWLSYWIGCLAGIIPWVIFAVYIIGAGLYGSGQIPTFVYWIYASIFVFFNSFAINMYLQYKKKGKWSNYLYGERTYMVLSLVAKSALAWQVFAGTLRP